MKLKQLLEQLNQLAKERPEALEMEVLISGCDGYNDHAIIHAEVTNDQKQIILH